MTAYAFIHGAGDVGWYWHLVEAELRADGHDTVAPDLPVEDDDAGLERYAQVVVDAIGGRRDAVLVAQSFGGYVAPIVAARRPDVSLIVLVAGMIPKPGESADEMFRVTGWRPGSSGASELDTFYHDVPAELARSAMARGRRQSDTPGSEPWPLARWPDVPVRFVLCRNDRFFPATWLRDVVRERLALTPLEIDSGHCPALSRPTELAELLARAAAEVSPG